MGRGSVHGGQIFEVFGLKGLGAGINRGVRFGPPRGVGAAFELSAVAQAFCLASGASANRLGVRTLEVRVNPAFAQSHPVSCAERHKGDHKTLASAIEAEDDGQAIAPTAVTDEPAVERPGEAHTRARGLRDLAQERVDFIQPSQRRFEVAMRHFHNMLDDPDQVLFDQRVLALPHQDFARCSDLNFARCSRAREVKLSSGATGSH